MNKKKKYIEKSNSHIGILANAREAALAPKQGTLPPPPAYGDVRNTIMLFEASETDTNNQQHLEYLHTTPLSSSQPTDTNPPPPQYT